MILQARIFKVNYQELKVLSGDLVFFMTSRVGIGSEVSLLQCFP